MSLMCDLGVFYHAPPRRPRAFVVLGAAIVATAACSSSHSSSPTGPGSGSGTASLTVVVNVPFGVAPNVVVTGPSGYSDTVHATTTLKGLAAGAYAVTGLGVIAPDSIIGAWDTASVSGAPANLATGGNATVTVGYAARLGSGGLWVANVMSGGAVRYAAGQLRSTTSLAPGVSISTGQGEWAIAFDKAGNLWVAEADNNTVSEYAAAKLGASGSPTPAVTLTATAGSLHGPGGLAFDRNGNLWVANGADSTLVEFTASQLTASGSPVPAVIISSSAGAFSRPEGLAFDASGNLWVANSNDASVIEFSYTQIATTGAPAPAVVIGASSGSLNEPYSVAFDANGNLWVAYLLGFSDGAIVEYSKAQQSASGTPTPTVTITASGGSLNGPAGLAFDASHDLWVANEGGSVVEFTPSQLGSNGTPTPKTVVTGSGINEPFALAFDPHPAGLPLQP